MASAPQQFLVRSTGGCACHRLPATKTANRWWFLPTIEELSFQVVRRRGIRLLVGNFQSIASQISRSGLMTNGAIVIIPIDGQQLAARRRVILKKVLMAPARSRLSSRMPRCTDPKYLVLYFGLLNCSSCISTVEHLFERDFQC